jgi:hypothetical protein
MKNGGVLVGLLMLAVVSVVSAHTANKPVGQPKLPDAQADAQARQISPELLRAVQVSNVGNVGSSAIHKMRATDDATRNEIADCLERLASLAFTQQRHSEMTGAFRLRQDSHLYSKIAASCAPVPPC